MKLSINSSIVKSTSVEMLSPVVVESHYIEKTFQKPQAAQAIPVEFTLLASPPGIDILTIEEDQSKHRAAEIVRKAETEAQSILTAARNDAEGIIQAAHQEADRIRQMLEETIREEIRLSAQAEGYEKGMKEASDEAARIRKQAQDYLTMAQRALTDEFYRTDKELIQLCIKICDKILHSTLRLEPNKLLGIIRSLSLMPREKQGMKLHISSEDWEWVKNIPEEDKPAIAMVIDDTLRVGNVYLECEEGLFDARMDAQLERIEQFLLEELSDGLDGTGKENRYNRTDYSDGVSL